MGHAFHRTCFYHRLFAFAGCLADLKNSLTGFRKVGYQHSLVIVFRSTGAGIINPFEYELAQVS